LNHKEIVMRYALALAAMVLVPLLTAPSAHAATTWCANDGEDTVCGFVSFQQCLDFAAGINAFCDVDRMPRVTEAAPATPRTRPQR